MIIAAKNPREQERLDAAIRAGTTNKVYIPYPPTDINPQLMSRFIGKVALEAIAQRCLHIEGWRDEFLAQEGLMPLRVHVRRGGPPKEWSYSRRQIYSSGEPSFEDGYAWEILHEYDFVPTEGGGLLFALAILGEEFMIDMAGPELTAVEDWIASNDGRSPLYPTSDNEADRHASGR